MKLDTLWAVIVEDELGTYVDVAVASRKEARSCKKWLVEYDEEFGVSGTKYTVEKYVRQDSK